MLELVRAGAIKSGGHRAQRKKRHHRGGNPHQGYRIGLAAAADGIQEFKRDWRFLLARRTLLAFAAILLLVPWYAATYRMAASGWELFLGQFHPGRHPVLLKAFVLHFGIASTVGFLYGAARAATARGNPLDIPVFALAAICGSALSCWSPADLRGRYLVPVYPCAAMVAVWGFLELFNRVLPARAALAGALTVLLVGLSIWQGFWPPHVESFRTGEAFAQIRPGRGGANPLILVSGGSRFEGAMSRDGGPGRSTAASSMCGVASIAAVVQQLHENGCAQRSGSAAEMRDWLVGSQIGWIVIEDSTEAMRYGHNVMLMDVVAHDPRTFQPVWSRTRQGGRHLFQTPAFRAAPQHIAAGILAVKRP